MPLSRSTQNIDLTRRGTPRWMRSAIPLVALTLAIVACENGSALPFSPVLPIVSGGGSPTADTVEATPDLAFQPPAVTIIAGSTVTFRFDSVAHNVFFDPQPGAPADIPGENANTDVTVQFDSAGTFTYQCHIHPQMQGTVIVQ